MLSACQRQLSLVNLNAAGIDVGATSHFAAVSADRAEPPVREFAALNFSYAIALGLVQAFC